MRKGRSKIGDIFHCVFLVTRGTGQVLGVKHELDSGVSVAGCFHALFLQQDQIRIAFPWQRIFFIGFHFALD